MAAWFDGIEVYVELSWGNGPRTAIASMTWTDYADDVVSIDVSRGSQSEFGDFPPGTATIVINDPGRVFDASNTAGPNYGEVVPMVPVRIRAVAGATSAALFLGYVASSTLSWPVDGRAPVCVLTCVDGTRVLEATRLPGSAYEATIRASGAEHYWPLQEWDTASGYTPDAVGGAPMSSGEWFGGATLTAYDGAPLGGDLMVHGGGTTGDDMGSPVEAIAFWVVNTGNVPDLAVGEYVTVSSPGQAFTFFLSDGAAQVRWVDTDHNYYLDFTTVGPLVNALAVVDVPVHVAAYVTGTTSITVLINGREGWSSALTAGAWPKIYSTGVTLGDDLYAVSHLAAWATAPTAADFLGHVDVAGVAFGHPYGDDGGTRTGRILDAIDHPSADRDIDAGSTVLDAWLPAGGDALSAIRETIAPEQALVYFAADGKAVWRSRNWQRTAAEAATAQATFGDQTGEIRYTDDVSVRRSVDDIYNHTTVSYNDGSVSVEDATSIAAYGEQRESISATLIDDTHTARQLAAMRVREHKDAADRIEALTVLPRRDTETVVATLLELDLGYRVAVNRRPTGGTGSMALEMSVRGISHHINRSAVGWVSTLYLAPAMTSYEDGPWLTLGDADYGLIGPSHAALDGTSGCYLSTPDAAVLDITGDLEVVALVAADDWTPAAPSIVAAKYVQTGDQRSWRFCVNPGGNLQLYHSTAGTAGSTIAHPSTAAPTVTNGSYLWLKVTLDVDNGAGGHAVKFYTAAYASSLTEPSSWTQLGSTVTTAGTTSIYAGTAPLEIGSFNAGTRDGLAGSVARAIVRNGIGGTTVFDFDAAAIAAHGQATIADQANAATITANGTARLHPANLIPY